MERMTGGGQCWYATTDDFQNQAERHLGGDLEWFVKVYLRQPKLPVLHAERQNDVLALEWEVPEGLVFPMPVDIQVDDTLMRVAIPEGGARVSITEKAQVQIDPHQWILKELVKKNL